MNENTEKVEWQILCLLICIIVAGLAYTAGYATNKLQTDCSDEYMAGYTQAQLEASALLTKFGGINFVYMNETTNKTESVSYTLAQLCGAGDGNTN